MDAEGAVRASACEAYEYSELWGCLGRCWSVNAAEQEQFEIPIEAKARRSRSTDRYHWSLSSVIVRAVCARSQLRVSGEDRAGGACDP